MTKAEELLALLAKLQRGDSVRGFSPREEGLLINALRLAAQADAQGGTLGTERGTVFCGHVSPMTKTIMDEALEEVRRNGRLDIQERVFAKMKPHDPLADLVAGFSKALLEKLRAAEAKYGYKNDWLRSDWEAECQKHLAEHLAKGDPRDVAAYAAFCWHHGWPTSALEAALAHPGSGDAEPGA